MLVDLFEWIAEDVSSFFPRACFFSPFLVYNTLHDAEPSLVISYVCMCMMMGSLLCAGYCKVGCNVSLGERTN